MSLSGGLIAFVALAYMATLFTIAFYGDRRRAPLKPRVRAWVFSLSLAVYCTSWTFFGAVGQAAGELWSFLPIYLGPIILLLLAPWVLEKMVAISKQENITSIADFIAARYGKSQSLAVVVALICLVGVLPYIALQLKAIVLGVNLLVGTTPSPTRSQDTALIVSLVLALFTVLFGTRNLDVTEHHRGMVLAIAFESLVKLLAFLAVGAFVTWGLFDGFAACSSAPARPPPWKTLDPDRELAGHAGADRPGHDRDHLPAAPVPRGRGGKHRGPRPRLARWVFPLYLVLAALFVVPIALAGQMLLPAEVEPDSFVISLPLAEAHPQPGDAGLYRRRLGGHRHGHRRGGGAVDDGLERHAAAAAAAPAECRAPLRAVPPLDAVSARRLSILIILLLGLRAATACSAPGRSA